jgi:hypothetical protein
MRQVYQGHVTQIKKITPSFYTVFLALSIGIVYFYFYYYFLFFNLRTPPYLYVPFKKSLETSFPEGSKWGFFCGSSTTYGGTFDKVSACIYFFLTNEFNLSNSPIL